MPEMDGFEVARSIGASAQGATVPIIATPAAAMFKDKQASQAAGMITMSPNQSTSTDSLRPCSGG